MNAAPYSDNATVQPTPESRISMLMRPCLVTGLMPYQPHFWELSQPTNKQAEPTESGDSEQVHRRRLEESLNARGSV